MTLIGRESFMAGLRDVREYGEYMGNAGHPSGRSPRGGAFGYVVPPFEVNRSGGGNQYLHHGACRFEYCPNGTFALELQQ